MAVSLDQRAVIGGAAVTLVIAVPAGFAERVPPDGSSWKGLLFAIVLVGFGVGGAVAGRSSAQRYLTAGAAAGLVAVVGYLLIGIVAHLATGDSVRVASLVFTALLGMCCGMLGAEIGARWRRRRESAAAGADGAP